MDTTGDEPTTKPAAPYLPPRLYTLEHLPDGRFAAQCTREGVTFPIEYFAEADEAVARVQAWIKLGDAVVQSFARSP